MLQGMLAHPGWHAVVPCSQPISLVYLAVEHGELDHHIDLSCLRLSHCKTLQDLAAIPNHLSREIFAQVNGRIFAAHSLTQATGDPMHHAMLETMGEHPIIAMLQRMDVNDHKSRPFAYSFNFGLSFQLQASQSRIARLPDVLTLVFHPDVSGISAKRLAAFVRIWHTWRRML